MTQPGLYLGSDRRMKASGQSKTQDDWPVLEASDSQGFTDKHLCLLTALYPKTSPKAKQTLDENTLPGRNPTE